MTSGTTDHVGIQHGFEEVNIVKYAERDHLSFSALKQFCECEEAAVVGYRKESKAFLEGQIFEAAVTDTLKQFLIEHEDDKDKFFRKDGIIRSEFANAINAANRLRADENICAIIDRCLKQVAFTGEINGIPFVGIVDLYDSETNCCYDLKFMRNFGNIWNSEQRYYESWQYAYKYDWQAAIYRHLTKGCTQHLIAATKETVPDVGFWQFSNEYLDKLIPVIGVHAEEFWSVVQGERQPKRCGKCDYCKSTKKLTIPDLIG